MTVEDRQVRQDQWELVIACDECPRWIGADVLSSVALRLLCGWKKTVDGRDLCVECQERTGQRSRLAKRVAELL